MSEASTRREGIYSLLCDGAGTSPFAFGAGEFTRVERGRAIEEHSAPSCERRVEVRLSPSQPIGDVRGDHWSGRSIRVQRFVVRVGYYHTREGVDFDASGGQSGGAHRDAIEDRAEMDRSRIVAVLGYLPNWAAITALASSCRELAEHTLEWVDDIAVLSVVFELVFRTNLPGALTPDLVGS